MWRDAVLGLVLVMAAAVPTLCNSAPLGTFTIVEGEVTVIRDALRFAAAEGLPVQPGDLVHTAGNARLARIELADGGVLDLGPATRLLLQPRFSPAAADRPAPIYLQRGWLKLAAPKAAAGPAGIASPRFDVARLAGTVVVRVGDEASAVFVESGRADLIERRSGVATAMQPLKDGQAYAAQADAAGSVAGRLPAELLQQMPRAFADSLPRRAARFERATVEPASPREIGYDDIAHWINAEPALRPAFRDRWAGKAADPRFRASLVAELKLHPEWTRLLAPPRSAPKRPADLAKATPPPAGTLASLPTAGAATSPPPAGTAASPPPTGTAASPPSAATNASPPPPQGAAATAAIALPPSPPIATVIVASPAAAEPQPDLLPTTPWPNRSSQP